MASISFVRGAWRALIRRKGYKSISKSFPTKAKAVTWAKDIEGQVTSGKPIKVTSDSMTIAQMIDKYHKMRSTTRPILDTSNEHYVLLQLKRNLGHIMAAHLTVDDLVAWATSRREADAAGPYTVNIDLGRLGTIYRYASSGLPDVVGAARPKLTYLGLIGGGGKRDRRPTEDETFRIREYMLKKHGQVYVDAIDFAATSAMRRGEVFAIKFADVNNKTRMVEVWRKHPRKGKVLERVPLLGRAWEVYASRPRDDERIFPLHPQTMSKYFRGACAALGIPDLQFRDFRHEGTSALFEEGFQIHEVALVTGHKKWETLRIYTNLKPEALHARGTRPDKAPTPGSRTT